MIELTGKPAEDLVASLLTIGHPSHPAALRATLGDVQALCKGGSFHGRPLTPWEQAVILIDEARATWKEGWPQRGGTARLFALYHQLFDEPAPEFRPYEVPPPASCSVCGDTGWESFERDGCPHARRCKACDARVRPVVRCPDCGGKETKLVGGRRQPCGRCLSPERRRQIQEWLSHSREAS